MSKYVVRLYSVTHSSDNSGRQKVKVKHKSYKKHSKTPIDVLSKGSPIYQFKQIAGIESDVSKFRHSAPVKVLHKVKSFGQVEMKTFDIVHLLKQIVRLKGYHANGKLKTRLDKGNDILEVRTNCRVYIDGKELFSFFVDKLKVSRAFEYECTDLKLTYFESLFDTKVMEKTTCEVKQELVSEEWIRFKVYDKNLKTEVLRAFPKREYKTVFQNTTRTGEVKRSAVDFAKHTEAGKVHDFMLSGNSIRQYATQVGNILNSLNIK